MAKSKKTPPELDKAMDIILRHRPVKPSQKKVKSGQVYQSQALKRKSD